MADWTDPRGAPAPGDHRADARPRSARTSGDRRVYAALDLGTNNCRLLIARPTGDDFTIIDAFSRIVRLGEGLGASGRLSDAAMDRAVAALSICADKLRRRGVDVSRAVATEACRRASNGAAFVERVRSETGIQLDVIDAGEEARLAVSGCHMLLEPGDGPAMIFDIGGGSTELVRLGAATDDAPAIATWRSLPWGVVSLTEAELPTRDDRDARIDAYDRMRARVRDSMADFPQALACNDPGTRRLLGTSGTVTTLGSVHLRLPSYDRKMVDGLHVAADDLRAISFDLAQRSLTERAAIACIGHERADLVVAGCAILDAILDVWPAPRVGIADRGIREGVLRKLMASNA